MNSASHTILDSPVGPLVLAARDGALVGLYYQRYRHLPDLATLGRDDRRAFATATEQLDAYFHGALTTFDVPISPSGTPFQMSVWRALRDIPYGSTETYAQVARRIGHDRAVRAVGAANGRNPISIIVPCHRVIGTDGGLTGYGGGVDAKRLLLDLETLELETLPTVAPSRPPTGGAAR